VAVGAVVVAAMEAEAEVVVAKAEATVGTTMATT